MIGIEAEVEGLRSTVSRFFRVYDTVVHPLAVTFKVFADPQTLDANFDALRKELVPKNYVPAIAVEGGEHVVHVQRRPQARFARPYVNVILLAVTIATALVAGALNWAEYSGGSVYALDSWALGFLSFSLPLLTILGSHEMGHYVVAKRHNVHASLPFFLPSIPPLGTFGAFISMRDPIPNRKALLDIGVSGPAIGFLVSIPIVFLGLWFMTLNPVLIAGNSGGQFSLGWMFLFQMFVAVLPVPPNAAVHPTVFAGYVGLFVTSINLLPAGQLDGGHIARALLGERSGVLSWITILALLALGLVTPNPSWLLFALIILMLGSRHPPPLNDLTRLAAPRKLVAVLAIALLVLTFTPAPLVPLPAEQQFEFQTATPPYLTVTELQLAAPRGTTTNAVFRVNNTGNVLLDLRLHIEAQNLDVLEWNISFVSIFVDGRAVGPFNASDAGFALNSTEAAVVTVSVFVPSNFLPGAVLPQTVEFSIAARVVEAALSADLTVSVTVPPP